MILDQLVAATQRRLAQAKARQPLVTLQTAVRQLPPQDPQEVYQAFARPGVHVIAELKKASPSKGQLVTAFPYQALAQAYQAGGATAISVLTEPTYFQGNLAILQTVAQTTSLPVLRKDFVIDEYMLYQARLAGAKLVLLIAAILSDQQLLHFMAVAHRLGLAVLLEVHDQAEVQRAIAVQAPLVGINNRDLKTFQVDLQTSLHLQRLLPATTLTVAESGIATLQDMQRLARAGFNGALIGETLIRAADPVKTLQTLRKGAEDDQD